MGRQITPYRIPKSNPLVQLLSGAGIAFAKKKGAWPGDPDQEYKKALLNLRERELSADISHKELVREDTKQYRANLIEREEAKFQETLLLLVEQTEAKKEVKAAPLSPSQEADVVAGAALTKKQTGDIDFQQGMAKRKQSFMESTQMLADEIDRDNLDLSREKFSWQKESFYLGEISKLYEMEYDATTQAWLVNLKAMAEAGDGAGLSKQKEKFYGHVFSGVNYLLRSLPDFEDDAARNDIIEMVMTFKKPLENYAKDVGATDFKMPDELFMRDKILGVVPNIFKPKVRTLVQPQVSSKVRDAAADPRLSDIQLPFDADDRKAAKNLFDLTDDEVDQLEATLQFQSAPSAGVLAPPAPRQPLEHPGKPALQKRKKLLETKLKEVRK